VTLPVLLFIAYTAPPKLNPPLKEPRNGPPAASVPYSVPSLTCRSPDGLSPSVVKTNWCSTVTTPAMVILKIAAFSASVP